MEYVGVSSAFVDHVKLMLVSDADHVVVLSRRSVNQRHDNWGVAQADLLGNGIGHGTAGCREWSSRSEKHTHTHTHTLTHTHTHCSLSTVHIMHNLYEHEILTPKFSLP